jgi:NADPH-dependent 2,4-dienoyl-CoA reductase/sulfur reductase-like enzyme
MMPQMHTLSFLFSCFLSVFSVRFVSGAPPFPQHHENVLTCDVIIAGGSLASLAAAIAAANYSSALTVCFLEPTDWPGGQLTASAVPAVDFGPHNRDPANVAQPFASFLFGESMPGDVNLGGCWVSEPCIA